MFQRIKYSFPILIFGIGLWLSFPSCKHVPLFDDIIDSVDTTSNPIDTMPVDKTGIPCDPDVIYFEQDVLPMLICNCAFSGCHAAALAQRSDSHFL